MVYGKCKGRQVKPTLKEAKPRIGPRLSTRMRKGKQNCGSIQRREDFMCEPERYRMGKIDGIREKNSLVKNTLVSHEIYVQ